MRPRMQMIFQDPISSLNPRRRVREIVGEGLDIWEIGDKSTATAKVDEVLDAVGIDPANASASAARVLRRAVPAHLDRPRGRHRAEADHLRRAGLGARRVGAGPDPQPAPGHEGALRAHARVHRARPRGGEERERPGHGDVPRQDVRGRATRRRSTSGPRTRTPRRCSPRSRCPTPTCAPTRRRCSAARSRHPCARRVAAASARGARKAQERCAAEEPELRKVADSQFVACHFPLAPGEQLDFAKVGVGATIGLDEDTRRPQTRRQGQVSRAARASRRASNQLSTSSSAASITEPWSAPSYTW